jgi:protein-disulfide isomerase
MSFAATREKDIMISRLRTALFAGFLPFLLLLPPAFSAHAEGLQSTDRAAIEQIVHDYLLQHPDVVIQALQGAEEKLKKDSDERSRAALLRLHDEIFYDHNDPVAGNPKGDVTLVEFFDYRCPYCKQVAPALNALLGSDPNLRIVYKEFPILSKESTYAARVALAAQKQGKYLAFHMAMMNSKGQISDDVIQHIAAAVGLDLDKIKADMDSSDIEKVIKHNHKLAEELDIRGTPAFIIGNELIPGAADLETLREKIAALRKAG